MVTKAFKKELKGLSPWQLTMAVKDWMKNHDARLQVSFNWENPDKDLKDEYTDEDFVVTKSTEEEKPYERKKIGYVKL